MDGTGSDMLRGFVGALHRSSPRKLDWRRFYDFVILAPARGRDTFAPDDLRTVLLEGGLAAAQAEPFVDFYVRALDLLTYDDAQAG